MLAEPSLVSKAIPNHDACRNSGRARKDEGDILRFVFWHSIAWACLMGILVFLMAYVYPFSQLVAR